MNWEQLSALSESNVHIVGLASTEGASVTSFLWSEGFRRLTVHDFLDGDVLRAAFRRLHVGLPGEERDRFWDRLGGLPIHRCLGERYLEGIEGAEAIFAGQGWYLYPPNFPALARARDRGVPFHSLTELYFGLSSAPILAVTGSNGKSTTSRLAHALLATSGRRVLFGGNERRSTQVLDQLRGLGPDDRLVLEVSNRQLIDLTPRPAYGVITNILPNHLEEHGGSFAEYVEVKRNLLRNQRGDDFAVLNADDPTSVTASVGLPGQIHWFSRLGVVERGAYLADGHILLADGGKTVSAGPMANSPLAGAHNESNVLAAAVGARLAGADPGRFAAALRGFQPLRHRLQLVRRAGGVEYYDDLNSTTPQATIAALNTLARPVVWIAGGEDKGLSLDELIEVASICRRILVLPGSGSERLLEALSTASLQQTVEVFDDLRAAVTRAVALALPGDGVLLSPAFPGFFSRHYTDEAGGFRSLLRELAGPAATPVEARTHG